MAARFAKINASKMCPVWLYGPQVSDLNKAYGVGGVTWKILNGKCSDKDYILLSPKTLYASLIEDNVSVQDLSVSVIAALKRSKDILDVLMIYSAFINTSGNLISMPEDCNKLLEKLHEVYTALYVATRQIVTDEETMSIFVSPDVFYDMDNSSVRRPKNIAIGSTSAELIAKYKIDANKYIHPIPPDMITCAADINSDCTIKFANINNPIFSPFAKVISCHCSFFKQKLEKLSGQEKTFKNMRKIHKISEGDYTYLKHAYASQYPSKQPPIMINKYKDNSTRCGKHTYLSQLFAKTCSLLYKPYHVKAKTNTREDIEAAARQNRLIGKHGCSAYSDGNLGVFQTPIIYDERQSAKANVQVMFILEVENQQPRFYADEYTGPTFQFYATVFKELVEHKVFVPTDTFFNNQRYELNTVFDISTLESYKKLPNEIKTPALKAEVTEYFFLFIGNLIHFAIVNNIELPFKLSRVYIMRLFGLFDFTEIDQNTNTLKLFSIENLDLQLLLISIYLLEKAPAAYTSNIIKIFEDPKANLVGNKAIFDLLDVLADDTTGSIKMNGYTTIVENNHDIYSENKDTLFYNVVEYLYKTALKHYFSDINSDDPIAPDFKIKPHLETFFKGFKEYREFHNTVYSKFSSADFSKYTFPEKLSLVRKLDIYISGFGITHDVIMSNFIPRILIKYNIPSGEVKYLSPLHRLNNESLFLPAYNPDPSLDAPDIDVVTSKLKSQYEKTIFYLYRILLNRGVDMPIEFIAQYNRQFYNIPYNIDATVHYENMTDEDYHNEFVKLLLKAWSGVSAIGVDKEYKIHIMASANLLPKTHTCFVSMEFSKTYLSARELYKDLVILVTEGSNFGEAFAGGGKKKR